MYDQIYNPQDIYATSYEQIMTKRGLFYDNLNTKYSRIISKIDVISVRKRFLNLIYFIIDIS